MEYGRIKEGQLVGITLQLPADNSVNKLVLQGQPVSNKIWMGGPRWGSKEWIGRLYPTRTRAQQFLEEYAKHYNAIELNATHYTLYDKETIDGWLTKTKERDFIFCPKVLSTISHGKSMNHNSAETAAFLREIEYFGDRLGPVFLQLSEHFQPVLREILFGYLERLKKQMPTTVSLFLEVRHPDWFNDIAINTELFDTLRSLGVGVVINDSLPHREVLHMALTIPKTFIRFSCLGNHPTDLQRIDGWAQRIKTWQSQGLETCYFFVHVTTEGFFPDVTKYAAEKLNEICKAELPEIKLLSLF